MNWLFKMLLESDPKLRVIDRRTHAALDHLTVAYFFCLAGLFWGNHRRATFTALFNAGAVMGTSLLTDYPGALAKVIPFETHGKIDLLQMLSAASMPAALGFGDEAAALPFYAQAMNEAVVVRATDWQGERKAAQDVFFEKAS